MGIIEELEKIEDINIKMHTILDTIFYALMNNRPEIHQECKDYFNKIMGNIKNFHKLLHYEHFWFYISVHYNLNLNMILKYHYKLDLAYIAENKFICPDILHKAYRLFFRSLHWYTVCKNINLPINFIIKFHYRICTSYVPDRENHINFKLMKYFKNVPYPICACNDVQNSLERIYFHHKLYFVNCNSCLESTCIFYDSRE